MADLRRPADAAMVRADALTALALAFAGALVAVLVWTAQIQQFQQPMWMAAPFSVLIAAPLAVRRTHPVVAMVATSVAYAVGGELGAMEITVSQVVLFLPFYSVGAWCTNRTLAFRARLATVIVMAIWLASAGIRGFYSPETGEHGVQAFFSWFMVQVMVNAAYFAAGWVFGDRSWQQAVEREALEQAQAEVRAQQVQLTEQAISLERLRIARELHDVVAHHVSAMGIQAGAARRVLSRDPERAATALRSVEESARTAISELGTMVGALRSTDESNAPMPTLADVRDLVNQARAHGPVDFEVVGERRELSPAVELTAYRVIQEALTNTRKHAGLGAGADVRIRYLAQALEVEIGDDGAASISSRAPGLGVGQRGMAERVAALGGRIEMGPKSRGGYLVRAAIPTGAAVREDLVSSTTERDT
ncbi:sensor histidine kinase [Pseudactinotalea terrae]|uniref:sensor histidine kinase n=1 Tax=Pseudactinotalea terrae TaxID=1743262 RepID=UPI0012E2689F|nr:histidine kinase [Pseudactinotalea terrae]